ncbi:MAG: hypothetical protein M0T85_08415 [Dehalococcoidales bacterium]|nr:hypothetical protein [Dehalococcoidales bacterium]
MKIDRGSADQTDLPKRICPLVLKGMTPEAQMIFQGRERTHIQ